MSQEQAQSSTVTQMPQVTDKDVKDAEKALGANSKSAFAGKDGVIDGTKDFEQQEAEAKGTNEGEEPEIQQIANDNKPAVPPPSDKINKKIMDAKAKMDEIKEKRSVLNAERNVIIEELKADGIDSATFEYACRVLDMDEDKRDRLDRTYTLVRQAGCKPLQIDIFATKH